MGIDNALCARHNRRMITKDELRKWREARGMSQSELAARLGVDQSTVSRIERGDLVPSPSVKIIFNSILAATPPRKKAKESA